MKPGARTRSMHLLYIMVSALGTAACSANAGIAFKADGTLAVNIALSLPQPVDAWARAQTGASDSSPMFDAAAVAKGARERGFTVVESLSPGAGSYRGSFAVKNLDAFIGARRPAIPGDDAGKRPSPEGSLSSLGILSVERGPGWASVRIGVNRGNSSALLDLFAGVDRQLMESLMPPALYDNPVTKAQYRSMLSALMGKAAAAAIDGALFTLSLTLPGPIIESRGNSVPTTATGRTVSFALPALDAMTLETPVDFYAKWKE